jgi:NAD(P)H-hydrate epimerase
VTIPKYPHLVPYLTTEQMIEVDRAMMEDFKIELIQMMENAGRNLAHLARERFFEGDPRGTKVVVLAGTGGNGGGALVGARRLHNYGAQVQVFVTKPDHDFTRIPAHQLDILHRMRVPVAQADALSQAHSPDLIITTGTVFDPAIQATATMTLALPKEGLRAPGVEERVGELYLADISVPPSLYAEPALGLEVGHLFAESDVIRLR